MVPRGALVLLALAGLCRPGETCAAEAPPPRPVLRVAYAAQVSSPIHAGAAHFKDAFDEASAGRAEVQLVPRAEQGDEAAIVADLRRGTVQVAILGGGVRVGAAAQIMGLPFLFRDPAHRRRVAEGAAGRLLARRIAQQSSLAVLAFFAGPEQVVATAAGPIARPADLRGMPLGIAPHPLVVEAVRGLGVLPMPLPSPLTIAAVRQRIVGGAAMDLETALRLRAYEVLPYMSQPATPFVAELYHVLADRRALASLPRDLQQALGEAMQRAARGEFDLEEEATARTFRELEGHGVKFAPLDGAVFREALRPFRETAGRLLKVQDLLAEIDRAR